MADSYATITTPPDEAGVFSNLLTLLQNLPSGLSLPTAYWGTGDPLPVMLRHGLSPLLATLYSYAAKVAQGGLLRPALALAKADLATWNTDPLQTFLGWLAGEVFLVTAYPPAFTVGTLRVTNSGGAVTLPLTFAVKTSTGLIYRLSGYTVAPTVPAGVSYLNIVADRSGAAYNVSAGAISQLVTSFAGIAVSNQPQAPAVNWITTFGGDRETPDSVATRCRANWARLARLQTSPADAYKALAKDQSITGLTSVTKVGVWPHYDGSGHAANAITLYLGSDAAGVSFGDAATVQAALIPYVGLHDRLYCFPCVTAAVGPQFTCYVDSAADLVPAQTALALQLIALQTALDIGDTLYAFQLQRACAAVPLIRVVEPGGISGWLDLVPSKDALIQIGTGGIAFAVGRP